MSFTEHNAQRLEEAIETMTNAFLRWPLPESVCADLCATKQGPGRIGTNLLTFTEANQMIRAIVVSEMLSIAKDRIDALSHENTACWAENEKLKAELQAMRTTSSRQDGWSP